MALRGLRGAPKSIRDTIRHEDLSSVECKRRTDITLWRLDVEVLRVPVLENLEILRTPRWQRGYDA